MVEAARIAWAAILIKTRQLILFDGAGFRIFVACAKPTLWGVVKSMTKTFEAKDWYLMFSSLVKTHLPEGASVQLWLRVDGDGKKKPECFENMYESRIKGTTAWNQHAVAVDVPVASQKITYGILLTGTGQVWLDDVTLEPVEGEIVIVATKGSTLAHILLIENARKHAPMML